MNTVLIKNAKIVNEGKIIEGDVLIENEYIVEIAQSISPKLASSKIIDAEGSFLIPGAIDVAPQHADDLVACTRPLEARGDSLSVVPDSLPCANA